MTGHSLWQLAEQRAAASPDAEMLVDETGRRVTFGAFRDRARRVPGGLHAAGIGAGTPVTWQLPTTVEALVLTAALARLGAVQNPVIPGYGSDRVGLVFPVAHVGGCGTWLGACLLTGCTLILDSAFSAARSTSLQARERVTIAGSGTVFTQIYLDAQRKQPGVPLFPDVRVLTAGASPRPGTLHGEVKRELGGIGVLSGYGMTEAPILSMAAVTDPDEVLPATEGRPCPHWPERLEVLDDLPRNSTGKVLKDELRQRLTAADF